MMDSETVSFLVSKGSPMKRRTRSILLASLLAGAVTSAMSSPVLAGGRAHARTITHPGAVVTTFRLQVAGQPIPGTTFWVAYGPLQGHWGVIRLKPHGGGVYSAWSVLPAAGRTTFVYLAAHGAVQTSLGPQPDGLTQTIKVVGPTTAATAGRVSVRWQAPLG